MDFKTGDYVYYHGPELDTFPGIVLAVKKRVKIKYNHWEGNRISWVDPSNLELQDEETDIGL